MTAFADFDERRGESKFRKTEYMKLTPGQHVVRFLEEKATKIYAHWLAGSYVKCLGEACPVCANNKQIIYEHPEDFRNVKGYSYKRERFAINLLDKTAEPKEVKVLSGGRTLFEDIDTMAQATRNTDDEIVDVRAYDWFLIVNGEGRDRTVTPVPQYRGVDEPVDLSGLELFDTENTIVSLTEEELVDAIGGASLKDIFALRKARKEVVDNVKQSETGDIKAEVEASVNSIFKQDD